MRTFQRVVLATVQIQPFARAQLAIQLRNPEDDMPLETMQHNVTCDLMRRDFRVGRDDQADSLEMPRFDEGRGLRVCELAAERALVENFPGVLRDAKPSEYRPPLAAGDRSENRDQAQRQQDPMYPLQPSEDGLRLRVCRRAEAVT